MVHDTNTTDMWDHDTLVIWSIIHVNNYLIDEHKHLDDADPNIWYEDDSDGKSVPVDHNPDKLTRIERAVRAVEHQVELLQARFEEVLVLDGYDCLTGIITDEEYELSRSWFDEITHQFDSIVGKYRMFRNHKDLSSDEYISLVESILALTVSTRELIRDKYIVMRAVDERKRIAEISDVLGT